MKRFLKWFGVTFGIIVLILLSLLGYAYFIEPNRLVITTKEIKVSHWSRELNGFKIVAVSDIHGGSNNSSEARLRYLSEQINAQNPDIVVLLGDFVSQTQGKHSDLKMPVETIAENIKGMRAKYGVYAVIGNHDWWFDEKRCRTALETAGIKVLENETFSFQANNQTVTIWGIEDYWKRRTVPVKEILEKIPAQQNIIAITHNPDSFDKIPETISLMVAGHTHGGQVLIPLYGAPLAVSQRKFYTKHYVENGRNLFVTSGFGTTGPPFRFMVPPEIAVIVLNSDQ
jgi:uncharacterized protein